MSENWSISGGLGLMVVLSHPMTVWSISSIQRCLLLSKPIFQSPAGFTKQDHNWPMIMYFAHYPILQAVYKDDE